MAHARPYAGCLAHARQRRPAGRNCSARAAAAPAASSQAAQPRRRARGTGSPAHREGRGPGEEGVMRLRVGVASLLVVLLAAPAAAAPPKPTPAQRVAAYLAAIKGPIVAVYYGDIDLFLVNSSLLLFLLRAEVESERPEAIKDLRSAQRAYLDAWRRIGKVRPPTVLAEAHAELAPAQHFQGVRVGAFARKLREPRAVEHDPANVKTVCPRHHRAAARPAARSMTGGGSPSLAQPRDTRR